MFKKNKNPLLEDESSKKTKPKKVKKHRKKTDFSSVKSKFKSLTDKQKFGLLLIVFALVIMFVIQPLSNYLLSKTNVNAVISVNYIEKGSVIEPSDIEIITLSKNELLTSMYLTENEVIGKYALTDISSSEVIVSSKISSTLPFDNSYIYTLADGKRAVSITLDTLAASVSSKIQSGDIVSIYSFSGEDGAIRSDLYPELTFVRILDVSDSDGFSTSSNETLVSTVTFEVNEEQAELLVGLEYSSTLHLSLISRGDEDKSKKLLDTQNDFFVPSENPDDGGAGDVT